MGASSSSETAKPKEIEDRRFDSFLDFVSDGKPDSEIQKDKFLNFFPPEVTGFAERLFNQISAENNSHVTRPGCFQALHRIASFTRFTSAQTKYYFSLYQRDSEKLRSKDCSDLLKLAYEAHCQISNVAFEKFSAEEETAVENLVNTIVSEGELYVDWITHHFPELFNSLHSWLIGILTGTLQSNDSSTLEAFPTHSILNGIWWWLLTASLPPLFSETSGQCSTSAEIHPINRFSWTCLYRSNEHGLSTNRLKHHVFAYRGPTILLVSCSDGYSYALAVDTEWKEGTTPWGSQNSFLIQISPCYRILEDGDQMVLFNEKSRNIPKGLFIGRDRKKYSLKIMEGLQSVVHDGQNVNVLDVEVWGCGGSNAKVSQLEEKKREKQDAERNAKVKLPGQWDENPDRLLLEWGGVRPSYGDQFKAEMGPEAKS